MPPVSERRRVIAFLVLAAASLLPWIGPATALAGGIGFSLVVGNPAPARTARWSKVLLQASVVGLGFGLSLGTVLRVGAGSAVYTVVGIAVTLATGALLGRIAGTSGPLSTLISFGTAICGGSAIAAMAPVVKAKSDEIAVSLATVFTLNAAALVLFPMIGHVLHLGQGEFGLWAGLAIHDTSSVVGAASAFGPEALVVATTVKLTRALWIMPCVLGAAFLTRSDQKAKLPLFIAGFVAAAAIRTLLPSLQPLWGVLVAVARQSLVLTLFLIGTGLTRDVLRRVGVRPLAQGVVLWLLVSGATLAAIVTGLIPAL
ncbi:MAG: putative sulfate exporter family transporter [Holophagales bacterium]|nr:putative sulfate exporter family transporter [Holophagales bacterium]MBK9963562.1 putative sulfate exporter family transporter [Holophagales bacterium]